MVSHEKIFHGPCGRWDRCRSLDVLKRGDHGLLGGYMVGNVMVVMMMVVVMVMRVRLLSLSSAKGRASAGAVFVVLDVVFLLLSPLVTGSTVAAALGIGCYVWWWCMLQFFTPP